MTSVIDHKVTRIEFWRDGQGFGVDDFTMSKNQPMDESRLEAEHAKLDYRDSSDEGEIRLFPHKKGADEPEPLGSDIHDGPNVLDT